MIGAPVTRRYLFKLQPRPAQLVALAAQRRLHCDLYNGLLQQRIEAYRRQGKTLTYYDQCKELTALRADDPEYRALSSDSMAATAQRVDRAMKAFFRRAKRGMGYRSGFPKFKRGRDYPGFGFKKHRSGWAFERPCLRNGRVRMQGIPGLVRARGKLPVAPEKILCCDVIWREGRWWLSLVVRQPARLVTAGAACTIRLNLLESFAEISADRPRGPGQEGGFIASDGRIVPENQGTTPQAAADGPDLGTERGLPDARDLGPQAADGPDLGTERGDPRFCVEGRGAADGPDLGTERGSPRFRHRRHPAADGPDLGTGVAGLQRAMARCKRGSYRYRALQLRKSRREARTARRRKAALHLWSTAIVRAHATVTLIAPNIPETTKSGRGDAYRWGAMVKTKARLNRHILDFAPGLAAQMLSYKIGEAGGEFFEIEPAAHETGVGNLLVAATIENRKLRRARNA